MSNPKNTDFQNKSLRQKDLRLTKTKRWECSKEYVYTCVFYTKIVTHQNTWITWNPTLTQTQTVTKQLLYRSYTQMPQQKHDNKQRDNKMNKYSNKRELPEEV